MLLRLTILGTLILVALLQVCRAQQASLGEVAKKLREERGNPAAPPAAGGQTLPEKAAQARKEQDAKQQKATRVYTNDDFKPTRPTDQRFDAQPALTFQQEEALRTSYHAQAWSYWCNIDRIQSTADEQGAKLAGLRDAVNDPFVQHNVNQLDSAGKQAVNDALSYIVDRETNKTYVSQDALVRQQTSNDQLASLRNQCSRDPKCRPVWLEVSREEREKSGCYQRKQ